MNMRIVAALTGALILVSSSASAQPAGCPDAPIQELTPSCLEGLQGFKSSFYSSQTRGHATRVKNGTAQPTVYTEVGGGDLPVSYYHYRVPKDQVEALAAAIPLPEGFSLAPIRIARRGRPEHYVSLTVYEVDGERSGLRAEWTTYVVGPSDPILGPNNPKPRVMMLETQTSEGSLDPVYLDSDPADVFEYSRTGDTLTTEIVSGLSSFSASFEIPPNAPSPLLEPGWNAASDVIYWSNGVYDLQNVNGLISNRRVAQVPPRRASIENQTPWAAFVEPRPRWVLVFDERIDAVIQPWVNIDDGDPDVPPLDPPGFLDVLRETKAEVFSENEFARADAIAVRMAEPISDFFVEPSNEPTPPSVFLNFILDPSQLDALAAEIPLPEGFEFARLRTLRGGGKHYFLSLNLYETQGIAAGMRAEWSVYVTKEGDPAPRYMVVEAQTSTFSLDSVNWFTTAADPYEYVLENGVIRFDVRCEAGGSPYCLPEGEPDSSFHATIPLPETPRLVDTTLDWTEANTLIYWGNGVADKIYYNGLVYDTKMISVPVRQVSISDGTRWAPFYLRLAQVLVFQNQLEFLASPWNNLNQLEDEIGAP
jgi:hypothetical protein